MGKSKKKTAKRHQKKAKPKESSVTLPSSMTVSQIQQLNALLSQRRVLLQFRNAKAGTLYVKRREDPEDMEVGLMAESESEEALRGVFGLLVEKTEEDLQALGINLEELEEAAAPEK